MTWRCLICFRVHEGVPAVPDGPVCLACLGAWRNLQAEPDEAEEDACDLVLLPEEVPAERARAGEEEEAARPLPWLPPPVIVTASGLAAELPDSYRIEGW